MQMLEFGYLTFSTYFLIIGIAFIIGIIFFFKISKNQFSKIDIIYVYVVNIFGFALGSKILSLIANKKEITIYNFINSGYSFLGRSFRKYIVNILIL